MHKDYKSLFQGSCHCGSILFEFKAKNIFDDLYKCNCSLCLRKSIVMKAIPKSDFFLLSKKISLNSYKWNKRIAEHFFCNVCGVYTHHIRRRDPSQISINIMCVDDILLPPAVEVKNVDGASHD